MNRGTDALIGPATADVAGHGGVDIDVARLRGAREQRRGRHQLTGLAIAALYYLEIEPSLLQGLALRRRADRLDRGDDAFADAIDCGDAGPDGLPVDMDRASAAECHAAAELRAGHAEHVAQHPQERRVAVDIDLALSSVYFDFVDHNCFHSGDFAGT